MKNLTTIDKVTAKELGARCAELLAQLETEYNVKVRLGGGKYDPDGTYVPKIEIALVREGGEVVTREAIDFKHYATSYGFEVSDLGAHFTIRGVEYKITGLKTGATRRPICLEEVKTGRKLVSEDAAVKRALDTARAK